jgi:hypothetical protein
MLVEPLADVEVNVPGVIVILVAPVVAQLSMLLAPELMPVGFAVNEAIDGADPFPDVEPIEVDMPQFTNAMQARVRANAHRHAVGIVNLREAE